MQRVQDNEVARQTGDDEDTQTLLGVLQERAYPKELYQEEKVRDLPKTASNPATRLQLRSSKHSYVVYCTSKPSTVGNQPKSARSGISYIDVCIRNVWRAVSGATAVLALHDRPGVRVQEEQAE